MRSTWALLAVAALLMASDLHAADSSSAGQVSQGRQRPVASAVKSSEPVPLDETQSSEGSYDDHYAGDECCDECGDGGCGNGFGRRGRDRFREDRFNCSCNGSYKYPVPPLYTYHWPGMYSHQLMTNYHSPWRFPAIRPFRDERPIQATQKPNEMRQAAFLAPLPTETAPPARGGEPESVSAKMRRYYQQ